MEQDETSGLIKWPKSNREIGNWKMNNGRNEFIIYFSEWSEEEVKENDDWFKNKEL